MAQWLVRLLGVMLMLTALAVAVSQAPDRPVQTLVARWAPPPSDFMEVQGQLVHYRDEGPREDGLPIVLVHGTSASLHTWEGWSRVLRPRRRVITFDLPGFGLTGPNADGIYSADKDARFVLALLDTLQVRRFVIGGNSLGGEVAWRVAEAAPQRVERLVLVDASGPDFTPIDIPWGLLVARVPVLNRISQYLLPREMVVASVRSVYGDPSRVTPELVDRYFELALREGNRRALVQRVQNWSQGGPAVERQLSRIQAPTLVLWGERDRLIPPAIGDVFARSLPDARLVRLPGLGHVPQEEDPARSIAPVLGFLGLK